MIPHKQLSLEDVFHDCQNKFEVDKPAFLALLEQHIVLDKIIPFSFYNHFYASTGRSRKYPLKAFLWALIIQRIFSIPTDQLLLTFLHYSKPLRDFCGFFKGPDPSKITRFKQDFCDDLQLIFDNLVDLNEPICQAIDSAKADMTIFDSSGIEAFVTEYDDEFFNAHPHIDPKVFLGDATFDSVAIYRDLLSGDTFGSHRHFSKAFIPLNSRSGLENQNYTINKFGIPCCPIDPSLPMKPEGTSKLKNGVTRFKFVCPHMSWVYDKTTQKSHRQCFCNQPCTSSPSGKMIYIYPEKDLRAYPGVLRGTPEWYDTYKIRTVVERSINHFKENLCLAGRKTQNKKTLHADLILSGITQFITVFLADKIKHHEYLRSLKPLIA